VKFLLATTDPQRLPVTVLSRCLQFNLKRLTPAQIGAQLEKILKVEGIGFDSASLALIARAADGSVRDALSLLDQAIAFGGGKLAAAEVREMLGSIDRDVIARMLAALAAGDAKTLLALAREIGDQGGDYDAALNELLLALHHIALAQIVPAALDPDDDAQLLEYAQRLPAEDVQLYYQIGLIGRRDLPLAPDPRTGLEMVLLRMLAFRPVQPAGEHAPPAKSRPEPAAAPRPKVEAGVAPVALPAATPAPATAGGDEWSVLIGRLKLTGLVRELANNMTLDSQDESTMHFTLDSAHAHLLNKDREGALRQAFETHFGRAVTLHITAGSSATATPAKEKQRQLDERQQAALEGITNDPNVRAIQEQFNARVNPTSVRPKT
jgi:DNA polymerase-3 subunit gamma/tau